MTTYPSPRVGPPAPLALRPEQFADSSHQHLAARRRVPLGPVAAVVFEDRQTVRFRVHELADAARRCHLPRVREQLAWYERLMPTRSRVRAAVWLTVRNRRADAAREQVLAGSLALLSSHGHRVEADALPGRVAGRLVGLVRWVEFRFTDDRAALHQPGVGWRLVLEGEDGSEVYAAAVGEEVLESLSADVG